MNRHRDEGPIVTFTDQWGAKDDESLLAAPLGHRWHEYCRYRETAERAAAKRASSVQAQRIQQEWRRPTRLLPARRIHDVEPQSWSRLPDRRDCYGVRLFGVH
jgi:hypothetical protein